MHFLSDFTVKSKYKIIIALSLYIILFGAMEVISTTLFPRCLPTWLSQGETVTIVGQVVNLDETARKVIIQPDP